VPSADSSASEAIRNAITAAGGAIGFDEFMRLALYGDGGFYTGAPDGGGFAGRRGDFLTSPEVGPLFGAVVAGFLDAEWQRIGRPDPFTVVEAGAGPGTLARAVLAARPRCSAALRYVAVEVSVAQRERHPEGVESVASIDAVAGPVTAPVIDGVIIANELLDNLPFRLAVFDGGWREAFVIARPDGGFAEVLSAPFDPTPAGLVSRPPHGSRAPIQQEAADWVGRARRSLRSGTVVVIDYMSASTAGLAHRPYRDWLRTYRGHERGDHPLVRPGTQDITAEVALDQLPATDVVRTQAQWLQRWGIEDLVAEGKRIWSEQAARPGLEAMRMRSRISEAEALLDPGGLGSFIVAQWDPDHTESVS
jgi:SAM-dependent MidA family methyltransferase